MKEIKYDTNKWEDIPCSQIGRMLKCLYYLKQPTNSVQSLSNNNGIFHRTKTNNSEICLKSQKILNSQSDLKKEAGKIILPDFRLQYKVIIIKTV